MHIQLFESYRKSKSKTEDYKAPEYLVQPADNDKGFFMFKAQFDALKSKEKSNGKNFKPNIKSNNFKPGISWKFADE